MKGFGRAGDGRIVTEYTVKFVDGGDVTEKTVPVGACAAAPVAPQKDGYVFSGWWVDQDYSAKFNLQNVVTSDMTLYAKWVKEYDYPNDKKLFNYGKQPGLRDESAWKSAPLAFKGTMFDVKDGTISWNEDSKEWKAEYQTSFSVTTLAGTYTEDGTMTLVEDSTGGFAKDDIPAIQAVLAGLLSGNATATPDDSQPQPSRLTEEELNAKMAVLPGNAEKYSFSTIQAMANNPLKGKTIGILGSSIVYGYASLQEAVGEYFAARFDCELVKEAVSGTTLTDTGADSYIQRMIRNLDKDAKFDLFICQLSTNDATKGLPMGTISEGRELEDFDTATVIGGMEYVICYAQKTWNCPVVFFTGTRFDNTQYGEMVAQLKLLEDKWDIGVLDLWSDDDFNNIPETQRSLYMNDLLHPTKAGYRDWWGSELERQLLERLSKK